MFSMQDIGKRIFTLRKENNMTQVELADCLGISYQAVSSWERGNSMPDISKIPEIAKLFHISIDDLIGESKVVNAILEGADKEEMKAANLSEGEIVEAIPILKPTQITAVMESVDKQQFTSMNLLPYMEAEDVKELALNLIAQGKPCDDCLPFMEEADVKEVARGLLEQGKNCLDCLPFMKEADVKEVARGLLEQGKTCEDCLPFMEEADVKEIALTLAKSGEEYESCLPFMAQADVKELVGVLLDEGKDCTSCLPFLGAQGVKELMSRYERG